MKVLYIMVIPLAVVIIGLFLVISELGRAVQRNTARLEAFYHIKGDNDPTNSLLVLNKELKKNRSIFDFNLSAAKVDETLCKNIVTLLISKAKNNRQQEFLAETRQYEQARCVD